MMKRYKVPNISEAPGMSEAARATTDVTCELLEDIRNHCQDALNFIPGHFMQPDYRKHLEESLECLRKELYELQMLGQGRGESE